MPERFEGGMPSRETEVKRFTVEAKNGASIVVEEIEPGRFKIVGDSVSEKDGDPMSDRTEIAFDNWDATVTDLDEGSSSISQLEGCSKQLQWNNVILGIPEIKAPSLERLKEAMMHVDLTAYCPGNL